MDGGADGGASSGSGGVEISDELEIEEGFCCGGAAAAESVGGAGGWGRGGGGTLKLGGKGTRAWSPGFRSWWPPVATNFGDARLGWGAGGAAEVLEEYGKAPIRDRGAEQEEEVCGGIGGIVTLVAGDRRLLNFWPSFESDVPVMLPVFRVSVNDSVRAAATVFDAVVAVVVANGLAADDGVIPIFVAEQDDDDPPLRAFI
ncbi:unnamed protein product, partial [Gongylonema pulchrum]|uniref:Uncharacterized protein n=1 Tax=Gongylonema pulchrum TaxID=637853 RepID=A0A183ECL7_9BILA